MVRKDPLRSLRFRLEIDGIQQAGFDEVSGLDGSTEAVDDREGNEPTHVRKLRGLARQGNLTLKRGVTGSLVLSTWRQQIVDGDIVRKNVAIVVIDEAGNAQARFEVLDAWPTRYDPLTLDPKGNEVAIEALELVHEGVKRGA
jgi:phage tail-like protein